MEASPKIVEISPGRPRVANTFLAAGFLCIAAAYALVFVRQVHESISSLALLCTFLGLLLTAAISMSISSANLPKTEKDYGNLVLKNGDEVDLSHWSFEDLQNLRSYVNARIKEMTGQE